MELPSYLKKYFWDTDFAQLDVSKNRSYILSRVLEYGDAKAAAWALGHFSDKDIKKVLRESRALSPKSGNFWAVFFNLPKSALRCLQKSSLKLHSAHWIG